MSDILSDRKPLVSIVIPAFNRAHLIGETIQSVIDQTYQNWELIVVDDGSDDNTKDVVREFCDDRIRLSHIPILGFLER
jgi:glycosyltransferase involved in cell wall biosynthesis